jgi:hypothetical integral membrane protein (TIGR02206 family)
MRQFSPPHLFALAVMVVAVSAVVAAGRRSSPDAPWTRWLSWGLAAVILCSWAGEYVADAILGTYTTQFTLPFQLTDLVSLTTAYALFTRRRWAVELSYFWAFTATLQAIVTPDLDHDFPSVFYFTYFGYHLGAVVGASFLVFGLRIYPRRWAAARTLVATLAWAALAGTVDLITGGNYMYLAWKPTHSSLLSVLGPWPWYIGASIGVAVLMLGIVDIVTRSIIRHTE